MKWLKRKIRKWLGVEDDIESQMKLFEETNRHIGFANTRLDALSGQVEFINKLVKVGVDVHQESDSWMVCCFNGQPEFVEFYRIPKGEVRKIQYIIKELVHRYGIHNVRVDAPPHARNYFRI